ncbi:hypothetical protein ACET3Z_009659 [Daucus carota]
MKCVVLDELNADDIFGWKGGLVGMVGTATEEFEVGRSLAESQSSEHVENGSPLIKGKLWNTETRSYLVATVYSFVLSYLLKEFGSRIVSLVQEV